MTNYILMFITNLQILLFTVTIKVAKNNIELSLTRRILQIVSDNKSNRFQELKDHLLKRKHPETIIEYSFARLFKPRKQESNDKNVITFTRTYNSNYKFSFNKFKNCIRNTTNAELEKAFNNNEYPLLNDNQIN